MIKGIDVILHAKTQIGFDAFHAPVYQNKRIIVNNVLVTPVASEAITTDLQLYGKKAVYELCIPKDDCNNWEDTVVEIGGNKYRTYGFVQNWIKTPGKWNGKIKVERYE